MLAGEQEAHQAALRDLEGLDGDVEAARNEVFAAINAATALRHAIQSATAARERVAQTLGTLEVEEADLRIEREALATAAARGGRRACARRKPRIGRARELRQTPRSGPRSAPAASTRRSRVTCARGSTTLAGLDGAAAIARGARCRTRRVRRCRARRARAGERRRRTARRRRRLPRRRSPATSAPPKRCSATCCST